MTHDTGARGSGALLDPEDCRVLEAIGPDPEDTAYYCDVNADWDHLKMLESRGLAATRDQSHWWATPAGWNALQAHDRGEA